MVFSKIFKAPLILACIVVGIVASPTLENSENVVSSTPKVGNTRDRFMRRILDSSPAYGNFSGAASSASDTKTPLKVGIIGAGAAGLYSAILLDSLGIDYEILEANTRIGGRIYTHRFDEEKWLASAPGEPDYYNYYVCIKSDSIWIIN